MTAITVIGYCLDILPLFTKEETMADCDNGNWLLFEHFATISRKKRWQTAITVIGYCLDILPLFTKEETMGDCDNGNWLLFGHFATIYEGFR